MLTARGLTKHYGTRTVLAGVDLTAPAGAVTALVGANGAGKTTAMRLALGLARGGGSTTFLGRPLAAWPSPPLVVGAALGGVAGHPQHRVEQHLSMVAVGAGVPRRRVGECLEQVGMRDARRLRLGALSLGMAQRVGLAQALLGNPRVLVLDEPGNGLDPHSALWLRELLRSLADEGRAVLVSSHALAELQQVADRIVVLARGSTIVEASAAEVEQRARSAIVVESPDLPALLQAAETVGARAQRTGGQSAALEGVSRQQIGDLAAREGLRIHRLDTQDSAWERFYLDVADEEFQVPWQ